MKPIVTIFEAIHPKGIELLSKFLDIRLAIGASRSEQLTLSAKSSVIIIKSVVVVDKELLNVSPNLRVIGRAGTGLDNIDLEEVKKRGVEIVSTPMGNTVTAAEFTILQILFLCRRMNEVMLAMETGDYRRHLLEGRELKKMTVGIVGLGNVGIAVAERLKPFGCKIIGWDPKSVNIRKFISLGGFIPPSFEDMLRTVDVLSLHVRLTPSNRHMISSPQFNLTKKGLLLINCARAGLIDDLALLNAIKNGQVRAASLDVLDPEPSFDISPEGSTYNHTLLNHPEIIVTPHIGASTVDAQKRISLDLAGQIKATLT
jgi:D-3-phosphoglycerate dehydrogenase